MPNFIYRLKKAGCGPSRITYGCAFLLSAVLFFLADLALAQQKLFLGRDSVRGISRFDINGTPAEDLTIAPISPNAYHTDGIAVDPINQRLYWADPILGALYRSGLDGSNVTLLTSGLNSPGGIDIDPLGDRLYWIEKGSPLAIKSAKLDGTNVLTITTSNLFNPIELTVDPKGQQLFYTDQGSDSPALIGAINLDGTNQRVVIDSSNQTVPVYSPSGITFDHKNSRIYWVQTDGNFFNFNSVKPDGTDATNHRNTTQFGNPTSVKLDLNNNFMYWTADLISTYALYRIRTDSSFTQQPTELINEVSPIRGLALWLTCSEHQPDRDNDNTPDCSDDCPFDPNKSLVGQCGCGSADTDTDSDGTADCIDLCPNDPGKIQPGTCGCGVSEVDADQDGTLDCQDQCPSDPSKVTPGSCGCGVADTDTDSDGTLDCDDLCPSDPDKTTPGSCGCGESDIDSDDDGTLDCDDLCPTDPNKTTPGSCGCGLVESIGSDGKAICDALPIVTDITKLTNPPGIGINETTSRVTLRFRKFGGVDPNLLRKRRRALQTPVDGVAIYANLLSAQALFAPTALFTSVNSLDEDLDPTDISAAKKPKLTFRYRAVIKKVTGNKTRNVVDLRTKKDQVTIRKLPPGDYQARYRVEVVRDKKVVKATNFSPAASFNIPAR